LRFLHGTLALAHNDINPANVMLDDSASPVVIGHSGPDDACVGERSAEPGSVGA
jgi:Ser/Thr protein kinase RdoA (MazF antagonist)